MAFAVKDIQYNVFKDDTDYVTNFFWTHYWTGSELKNM